MGRFASRGADDDERGATPLSDISLPVFKDRKYCSSIQSTDRLRCGGERWNVTVDLPACMFLGGTSFIP